MFIMLLQVVIWGSGVVRDLTLRRLTSIFPILPRQAQPQGLLRHLHRREASRPRRHGASCRRRPKDGRELPRPLHRSVREYNRTMMPATYLPKSLIRSHRIIHPAVFSSFRREGIRIPGLVVPSSHSWLHVPGR